LRSRFERFEAATGWIIKNEGALLTALKLLLRTSIHANINGHFEAFPVRFNRFLIIDERTLKVKSEFIEVNGMELTVSSLVLVRKWSTYLHIETPGWLLFSLRLRW
jgi:hypothetical protein